MLKKEEMDLRAKQDALDIVKVLIAAHMDPKAIRKMTVRCTDPIKQVDEDLAIYYLETAITGFYPEKTLEILRKAFNISCGAFAEHLRAFLIRSAVGDPWKIISAAWQKQGEQAEGTPAGDKISLSARNPDDLRRILIHIKMQLEQELRQKKPA